MAVTIDESVLMGIAAVVFIPVFLFCIKMIMKVGTIETKLDNMNQHVISSQKDSIELTNTKTELKLLEARVKNMEKDVDYLLAMERQSSGSSLNKQNRHIGYNRDKMDYENPREGPGEHR